MNVDNTPEDLPEEVKEIVRALLRSLDEWTCPHCGQPINMEIQVGRSVYAEPCGCRLGQGIARGRKPVELRGPDGGL